MGTKGKALGKGFEWLASLHSSSTASESCVCLLAQTGGGLDPSALLTQQTRGEALHFYYVSQAMLRLPVHSPYSENHDIRNI